MNSCFSNLAAKIYDATTRYTLRPKDGDRQRVIAAALREAAMELSYCGHDGTMNWVVDLQDLLDLANEIEGLKLS